MHKRRGADALVQALARAGVRRVFTVSGNHVMSVFDATIDVGIDLVHTRHEAAAVHMADAWGRLRGEPGIALVTGGPGHANALSALFSAQLAESPVVLLSGHAPRSEIGRGAFQELHQSDMAIAVAKSSWTASHADEVAADVARAIRIARSGRPGAVHVSFPSDVLEANAGALPDAREFAAEPSPLSAADASAIVDRLVGASTPLILTGPTGLTPGARDLVQRLEDATDVPVVGLESPRGVNDPSLGAFTSVLARADCIVLLGKRADFTLRFASSPTFAPACEFIQVDPESAEIERTRRAVGARLVAGLVAEVLAAAAALVDASAGRRRAGRAWRDEVRAAVRHRPSAWDGVSSSLPGTLHPVEACRPLQALLDTHPDSVLVSDGGEFGQWAQACLSARNRVINGPAGAIGAALPMALGARFASPEAPVVAMTGDGAFGFHVAEIDTAVRYGLPVLAVVGNDARWNAEYQIQRNAYGPGRLVGCDLLPTRYDRVVVAFGGYGEHVESVDDLRAAAERALASGLPACIDVALCGVPAPVVR